MDAARFEGPLDPFVAWRSFFKHIRAWCEQKSLILMLRSARAARPDDVWRACEELALTFMSHAHVSKNIDISSAMRRLDVMEFLCASHHDMPGALRADALIGAAPMPSGSASIRVEVRIILRSQAHTTATRSIRISMRSKPNSF